MHPFDVLELIYRILLFCDERTIFMVLPRVSRRWKHACSTFVCPEVGLGWLQPTTLRAVANAPGGVFESVLARVGHVTAFNVGAEHHSVPNAIAGVLGHLGSALTKIVILGDKSGAHSPPSATALSAHASMPNLEQLQMPVSKAGGPLSPLLSFPKLRWLCLVENEGAHPSFTDVDLTHALGGLHALRTLILKGFRAVTGTFASAVSRKVERVSCRGCGILMLGGLASSAVTRVDVQWQELTPELVMGMMASLPKIRILDFRATHMTDGAVRVLKRKRTASPDSPSSSVEALRLAYTTWNTDGVLGAVLAKTPCLRYLNLKCATVTPNGFKSICRLAAGTLEELHIRGVNVSRRAFPHVRKLAKLAVLVCDGVPDTRRTPGVAGAMSYLPRHIATLCVAHTQWMSTPTDFAPLCLLRGLTHISFERCKQMTDECLVTVARALVHVETVNICWCKVTEACMGSAIALWKNLRTLHISRSAVGTGNEFRRLRESPVQHITMHGSRGVSVAPFNNLILQTGLRTLTFNVSAVWRTELLGFESAAFGMSECEAQRHFGKNVRIKFSARVNQP